MSGAFGHLTVVLALIVAGAGAVLATAGAVSGRRDLRASARNAGYVVCGLVLLAVLAMEYALVTHDFSVSYVAQVGSRATPLFYTIISLWSSLEGSILLWGLILAGFTALFARWAWRRTGDAPMAMYGLGTLFVVNVFFLLVIAGPANPFERVFPVPVDGPGPNALLQNHPFMGVHPPLLYIGYVGMAVPFALTVGALAAGRVDATWARAVRRWTLVPWGFLSLGIVAGGWWSYEVLGWGGYWAWDPVENASFMPWLTGTAFLHSVMVQERRDMLKTWTVSLVFATFVLTLLGTFLTRSGVLLSVHAFTEGAIGAFFLGFMGLVIVGALALLAWKGADLRSEGRLDGPVCRESGFLMNNLLLAGFALVVLVGTVFPLLAEAVRGVKVSVGEPYFNRMNLPLALGLVFLAGVGPALPWRRGSLRMLWRAMRGPTAGALAVGAMLLAAGIREFLAWLTFVLATLSFGLLAGEVVRPAQVRRQSKGESWLAAVLRVVRGNRRRYGGYLVHAGVLLIAIGIAASSSFRRQDEWTLRIGEARMFEGYAIRLDSVWTLREPRRDAVVAGVSVRTRDGTSERFFPRINFYRNSADPVPTPAVRERASEDLYLVLAAYGPEGASATLQAIVSPLVMWIWMGGGVIGLGVLVAWDRKRRRPGPSHGSPAGVSAEELAGVGELS